MRAFTRRITYSAATLTAGIALTGCTVQLPAAAPQQPAAPSSSTEASSPAPNSPADPPPTSRSTRPVATGSRCTAKNLTATFTKHPATRRQNEPGIYAAEISLTNTGPACTTFGYAGLAQDGMHGPITTSVRRVEDPGPAQEVTMEHGTRVDANLTFIGGSQNTDSSRCVPPPARLEVIPPDDTQQIPVDLPADPQLINCAQGDFDLGPFYYTPND